MVRLCREGVLLAEKPLETDVPPEERRTYPLPLWPESLDTEYTVAVSFRLRPGSSRVPDRIRIDMIHYFFIICNFFVVIL